MTGLKSKFKGVGYYLVLFEQGGRRMTRKRWADTALGLAKLLDSLRLGGRRIIRVDYKGLT